MRVCSKFPSSLREQSGFLALINQHLDATMLAPSSHGHECRDIHRMRTSGFFQVHLSRSGGLAVQSKLETQPLCENFFRHTDVECT